MPRTLLLQMTNEEARYNPRAGIAWEHTNWPVGQFLFRTHEPVFWRVAMQDFRDGCLYLSVLSNDPSDAELAAFAEQEPRTRVERLVFAPFDFSVFSVDFSYYDRAAFAELIRPESPSRWGSRSSEDTFDWPLDDDLVEEATYPDLSADEQPPAAPEREFSFSTSLPLKQFRFEAGRAVASYQGQASPVWRPLELRVENSCFLPEFEYVKPFFARALGQRKLLVRVQGRHRGEEILSLTTHCAALEAIDQHTIGVVRYQAIRRAITRAEPEIGTPAVDKSLFTAREILSGESGLGDAFSLDERALLAEFIQDKTIRNRAQLKYLAGQLQDARRSLRFTLQPQFGFVFTIPGETMDHHVWELLDSHATYVWSFHREDVPPSRQDRLIQAAIGFIREQGRERYRRVAADQPEIRLNTVRHAHANSDFVDGFPRWRARLEELLA